MSVWLEYYIVGTGRGQALPGRAREGVRRRWTSELCTLHSPFHYQPVFNPGSDGPLPILSVCVSGLLVSNDVFLLNLYMYVLTLSCLFCELYFHKPSKCQP